MSLSLTPGSFLGLEDGQAQALLACCSTAQHLLEQPGDPGNSRERQAVGEIRPRDGKLQGPDHDSTWGPKVVGVISGWPSTDVGPESCGRQSPKFQG